MIRTKLDRSIPPYNPIVLDLDGTVVDSAPAIITVLKAACRAVGTEVDPGNNLDFCLGSPLEKSLKTLLGGADRVPEAVNAFRCSFLSDLDQAAKLMPGCADAIQAFAAQNMRLGVATYKPQQLAERVMERAGILDAFETIVGRDLHADTRSKADLLSLALQRLESRAEEAVYVGDRRGDQEAADRLGVAFFRYGLWTWMDLQKIAHGRSCLSPRWVNRVVTPTPNA